VRRYIGYLIMDIIGEAQVAMLRRSSVGRDSGWIGEDWGEPDDEHAIRAAATRRSRERARLNAATACEARLRAAPKRGVELARLVQSHESSRTSARAKVKAK
jgi:hypothetical protein